jgi:hypothetical protein
VVETAGGITRAIVYSCQSMTRVEWLSLLAFTLVIVGLASTAYGGGSRFAAVGPLVVSR